MIIFKQIPFNIKKWVGYLVCAFFTVVALLICFLFYFTNQEEKEIILNNQREMIKARIEMMELSGEQQKAALQALNGEIGSLNETQLKHTRDVLKKALDEENQLYKTSKDELKQMLEGKLIDRETYNKKLQTLETEHTQTMEALGTKYYQVMQNLDAKVKARTGQSWNYWEEAKRVLEEYGFTVEHVAEVVKNLK